MTDMETILTLAQKNIDTGMGLERLACVVQDVDSMFDIDTMKALRDHVCAMSGKHYGIDHETDVSLRVVTDHIRSVTFMISDGIMPSNEWSWLCTPPSAPPCLPPRKTSRYRGSFPCRACTDCY